MTEDSGRINLVHHFLIAMPGMRDEMFSGTVIYLCEHNERGALGLIINKPGEIGLRDLFEKVDLPFTRDDLAGQPVYQGGPVQTDRGFVLHEAQQVAGLEPGQALYASTLSVPGGLEMTTSRDVLDDMSAGGGPRRVLVTLGYSAWGEGQLESEIGENAWLTVPADQRVIFELPAAERYNGALALLGLQPWKLSPHAGHA